MLKERDIVRLILGLKVQYLRQEAGLSYQQLSDQTGLALSYLHSIEKGKKYPKADKIFSIAKALDTNYDYLVSLKPGKKLKPIVDLLRSDFLKIFPLETFGVSTTRLIDLLVQAPDKVNAFISTVLKITRNFNMQGEDFYKAALRSYQDLHDNYFPAIEQEAHRFRAECGKTPRQVLQIEDLEHFLRERFSIQVDREFLPTHKTLRALRSVFDPEQNVLFLNNDLNTAQEKFLLGKELGFQSLKLNDRPFETRMLEVDSFDRLLNNFHASYFSVALLLSETTMIELVEGMSRWEHWQPQLILDFLEQHDVTSEMLIQRLANVLPHHFNIRDLFFLRFYTAPDMQKFIVTKEMHLSQLHDPHANQLDEHYCRRWISIGIIRQLKARQALELDVGPLIGAQVSRYWDTPNAYFCIALAKPSREMPDHSTSVTIGLRLSEELRSLFPFLDDPAVSTKDVHTTCERCAIEDCGARAVPPVFLQRKRRKEAIRASLREIRATMETEAKK